MTAALWCYECTIRVAHDDCDITSELERREQRSWWERERVRRQRAANDRKKGW